MFNDYPLVIPIVLALTLILILLYKKRVRFRSGFTTDARARRILFVTAHPDDECMFFAPTIINLCHKGQYDVYLLCLSSGNFYSQGSVRQKELFESTRILGVRQSNVFIIDRRDLPDDPEMNWDKDVISKILAEYIFTFDEHGVSHHINHKSLHKGVHYFLCGGNCPAGVEGYKLDSVNLLRKYASFLDLSFSYLLSNLIFVSHWADIWKGQRAMYAHRSQFVWFRALYVAFSRYMIVNTYTPIVVN